MGSLVGLDLPVRLSLCLLSHVVIYFWVRYVVAPARVGKERLVRSLVLIPVLVLLLLLFDIQRQDEFLPEMYCLLNFIWLTPFKVYAFCMNRGQLVKSYDSGVVHAFVLGVLFPITIAFHERPIEDEKKRTNPGEGAYGDVEFGVVRFAKGHLLMEIPQTALRVAAKVCLMWGTSRGYVYFASAEMPFCRDYFLGWYIYGSTSLVEDLVGLAVLIAFNLKMDANFDQPYLAQSVTEFWARRYNVVFSETLRCAIYDPISEGRWVRGRKYYSDEKPSLKRKAMALMAAFGASGLLHMFAVGYFFGLRLPIRYCLFFVVNGFVVFLEATMKTLSVQSDQFASLVGSVPSWVCMCYVHVVMFALGHALHWPDLIEGGYADALVKGGLSFVKLA